MSSNHNYNILLHLCAFLINYSRLYLHIVEFGVLEDYRGKGIGTQLLNEIKKLAKELNIKTINLLVWDFNQTALNFYKKMGFDVYSNSLKFEVE